MRTFLLAFFLVCAAPPALADLAPSPSPSPLFTMTVFPSAPLDSVRVPEAAAPPQWAQEIMTRAQALPVVGPIVAKLLLWAGIVSSVLTALVCFLLAAIRTISGALKLGGLLEAAAKIEAFRNGPIMYWLKYLSMFNAKAPPPATAAASDQAKIQA